MKGERIPSMESVLDTRSEVVAFKISPMYIETDETGPIFIFHDIFIGEDEFGVKSIYFVAPLTHRYWNSVDTLKNNVDFELHGTDGNTKMIVNAFDHIPTEYKEYYLTGELSHPNLQKMLAFNQLSSSTLTPCVNITVSDRTKSRSQNFQLCDEGPDRLLSNIFNSSSHTLKKGELIVLSTIFKSNDAREVNNYVIYYLSIGVDCIVLYLHGSFEQYPEIGKLASKYKKEDLPVIFAEFNLGPYDIKSFLQKQIHHVQLTSMLSVFYRIRGWAKWIGFFDLDEFLVLEYPFKSLRYRFSQHEQAYPLDGAIQYASCNALINHINIVDSRYFFYACTNCQISLSSA